MRNLIRKSNIHDVKKLIRIIISKYIIDHVKREECMNNIGALLGLLASDSKIHEDKNGGIKKWKQRYIIHKTYIFIQIEK